MIAFLLILIPLATGLLTFLIREEKTAKALSAITARLRQD